MHDVRELTDPEENAAPRLARRGYELRIQQLEKAQRRRSAAVTRTANLRAELKRASQGGREADAEAREEARQLRDQAKTAAAEERAAEKQLQQALLTIPNIPLDEVPDGFLEKDAVEVRRGGPPPVAADETRHHALLGEQLGILDSARASKLSGARFSVARGPGARLERALGDFFLDLHTSAHGYTECSVPFLVSRETMTGTGQLPKFEDDLFVTRAGDRDLFLIPTAEVPLTNLFAQEVIDANRLPIALTARTPCFRAEAGSYGRDTRGVLRLHQFEKVELVRICAQQDAQQELALMLRHAEECLQLLELSYRVVLLPAGDMGFSARMTYDIEVWLPGADAFREISSVSDCGTFQGRRAGIRIRTPDGRKVPAATLNGSALPIGRTMAALIEQHRQPDGSLLMPEALVSYTGFRRILPDGSTTL